MVYNIQVKKKGPKLSPGPLLLGFPLKGLRCIIKYLPHCSRGSCGGGCSDSGAGACVISI